MAADSSDGSNWWKWALGCGCFGLIFLVCGGGVLVVSGGAYMASTVGETLRNTQATKAEKKERRETLESLNTKEALSTEISADELRTFPETIDKWRQSESVQALKTFQKRDKGNNSEVESWDELSGLWTAMQKLGDLKKDYLNAIEKTGGSEKHYRRILLTTAFLLTAGQVAAEPKFDVKGAPTEKSVAEYIVANRDKISKTYLERVETESPESLTVYDVFNTDKGNLGALGGAYLSKSNWETWRSLEDKERRKIMKSLQWALGAEMLVFQADPIKSDKIETNEMMKNITKQTKQAKKQNK